MVTSQPARDPGGINLLHKLQIYGVTGRRQGICPDDLCNHRARANRSHQCQHLLTISSTESNCRAVHSNNLPSS